MVVLLLGYLGYQYISRVRLASEISTLCDEVIALRAQNEKSAKLQRTVTEIDNWSANDVCWLDELDFLCHKFPQSSDAMFKQLTLLQEPNLSGGHIDMVGLAKDSQTVGAIESGLSDVNHKGSVKMDSEDVLVKPYTRSFMGELKITLPNPGGTKIPAQKPAPRGT